MAAVEQKRVRRRLAAILAADMVGFSRLMSADEVGTVQIVKKLRTDIVEPLLKRFDGRLIKTTGDGFLFEFGSVFAAFDFAALVQGGDASGYALRMGLNLGEIIIDGDDVFGDGVNIAARLEPLSSPGGLLLSHRAWEDLRRLPVAFEDAGALQLKNMPDPLRAWTVGNAALQGYAHTLEDDREDPSGRVPAAPAQKRTPPLGLRPGLIAAFASVLVLMAAGAWWALRSPAAATHSMVVRLAGFQLLSSDLPATIGETVNAEIAAAFNADGIVGVSTAAAPASGAAPAYAVGGTIQRDGQTIRVITRLTNERSGATLWSDNFNYDGNEVARVPRHVAVDAGNVVRCGLFGASTYRRPLPDPVLRDYMQFCQGHWDPQLGEGRKALIPAQRVTAAVPDFSWGWAAVGAAYWKVALTADNGQLADEARASGRQATDRAIAIDGSNSEALYIKSMLVGRRDWIGRESLLKRAVAARRLDCGCEHHQYGWMLMNVGRIAEAVEHLRQANDMLALYIYTPLNLADGLIAAGRAEEARQYFDAAINLAPNAGFANGITVRKVTLTGDAKSLLDPVLPMSAELRNAFQAAFAAMASGNAGAKAKAVRALLALPQDQQWEAVALQLARLGAAREAFQLATRIAAKEYPGPSLFWYRDMRDTLRDPGFPALAAQLGLMNYWKTTKTRPDVCNGTNAPLFCRMI